jgi:hypothetical protein
VNPPGAPQEAPADDYQLSALVPWLTRGDPVLDRPLVSAEIRRIYDTASKNLQRADAIMQTIAVAFYHVRIAQGTVAAPTADTPAQTPYEVGFELWQRLSRIEAPVIRHGVESMLESYTVQSWTVFETLVADLWEAALNAHPVILAELRGARGGEPATDSSKSVALNLIQRHRYNVSEVMGTILRERYRFDTLLESRKAYREAFSVDGGAIQQILANQAIDAANALRQVLVHRAGVVDRLYASRTENLPLAPHVAEGERIALNGEIVFNLLSAIRPLTIELFYAVDDWLVQHA